MGEQRITPIAPSVAADPLALDPEARLPDGERLRAIHLIAEAITPGTPIRLADQYQTSVHSVREGGPINIKMAHGEKGIVVVLDPASGELRQAANLDGMSIQIPTNKVDQILSYVAKKVAA